MISPSPFSTAVDCERYLVLFDLAAVIAINLDTSNSIDTYLNVNCGKNNLQTEVSRNGGKEPEWKSPLKFNLLFYYTLVVHLINRDGDRDDELGFAEVALTELRGGKASLKLFHKGHATSYVTFKFEVKKITGRRNLQIENMQLYIFESGADFLGTDKPHMTVSCGDSTTAVDNCSGRDDRFMWDDTVRLRMGDKYTRFAIRLYLSLHGELLAEEVCDIIEMDNPYGSKYYQLSDLRRLYSYGKLSFTYRSINLRSDKNWSPRPFFMGDQPEMCRISMRNINIDSPKVNFKKLQMRILIGSNTADTEIIQNAGDTVQFKQPLTIDYDKNCNKLTVFLYDSRIYQDKLIGRTQLFLRDIKQSNSELMRCTDKYHIGLYFDSNMEQLFCNTMIVSYIDLRMSIRAAEIHPYVVMRIGKWTAKTESTELGKKSSFSYRRDINLMFYGDDINTMLYVDIFDKDISTYELVCSGSITIRELMTQRQPVSVSLFNKGKEVGCLSFELTYRVSEKMQYLLKVYAENRPEEDKVNVIASNRRSVPKPHYRQRSLPKFSKLSERYSGKVKKKI